MKAWLSNLLYPLNLWSHSLACSHWLLRMYQRWLWDPLLENWLSNNPKVTENRARQTTFYTCVQCGRKKAMALVVEVDEEPSFFFSVPCRDEYALFPAPPQDSDRTQHPSV